MKPSVIHRLLPLFFSLLPFLLAAQHLDQFRDRLKKRTPVHTQTQLGNKFQRTDAPPVDPPPMPVRRTCSTMEQDAALRAKYPGMKSLAEEERLLQEKIEEYRSRVSFRGQLEDVVAIPVIVHVVHNGEAIGQGGNISLAQVQSQIDVLNEDFRRTGAGFNDHPAGADLGVEFVLAVEDPQGRPLAEPGIHRVDGSRAFWEIPAIESVLKPQTQWDPTRYFNMWTVQFGGDDDDKLGYAQFPSLSGLPGFRQNEGAAQTDGVVIRYQAFGRTGNVAAPYDGGRTTTHEVGHWLGLRHIWGDGDCSVDDFCDDTPPASQPNYSCRPSNSCGSVDGDMIENYMDYSQDQCMNIFTNDQKTRIRTVLMNSPRRRELANSTVGEGGGNASGAPVALFSVSRANACAGQTIRFSDQSLNNPTAWEWKFYDASDKLLATFYGQTQDITFNDPGLYSVELTASNGAGQDAYFEANSIAIFSDQLYGALEEDFEDQNTLLSDWILFNPDDDRTFLLSNRSAYGEGVRSIIFDNYSVDDDPSGTVDALISPAFDLSGAVNPYFYFDHAYATYDDIYSDTLVMFYSTDCGQTFTPFWFKGGRDLETAPATTDAFSPNANQWAGNQISLAGLTGESSVHILIANISGWGNNLYLDNISFFDGLDETAGAPEASFYTARDRICEGEIAQFQDYSSNYPTQWLWQFEGASPASSSNQHPFVTYNTPGVYDVTFQPANDFGADGFTASNLIEVVPLPDITVGVDVQQICAGQEFTLTARGASRYEWYDERGGNLIYEGSSLTLTLFQSVTYSVRGYNELGCDRTVVFQINVNPTPEEPVISVDGELLSAPAAAAYQWFLEDQPIADGDGGRNQTLVATQTGNYSVVVFNESGCFAISAPVYIVVTSAHNRLTDLSHVLRVFPNPTSGQVRLEMDGEARGSFRVEIRNAVGQRVRAFTWEKQSIRLRRDLDLSNLPKGVYTITLTSSDYRAVKRIVVAHGR